MRLPPLSRRHRSGASKAPQRKKNRVRNASSPARERLEPRRSHSFAAWLSYQIIIKVAHQEWRLARQHKQRLKNLRTQLGRCNSVFVLLLAPMNMNSQNTRVDATTNNKPHPPALSLEHEANEGKRRRANPKEEAQRKLRKRDTRK